MRCNTVTFTAADGHVVSLPFKPLIDRGAVELGELDGAPALLPKEPAHGQ